MLHRVLVKAWVQKGDKFLLAQRSAKDTHQAGAWSLPGGNVEGEVDSAVLEKTLQREVMEEVGVVIKKSAELIYNNAFIRDADQSHVVNLTFLCDWESGEARALEDTAEVKWFTLNELQNFVNPPDYLEQEVEELVKHIQRKENYA